MGSRNVARGWSYTLLGSSDAPASASCVSGTTIMCHCTLLKPKSSLDAEPESPSPFSHHVC